MDELRGWAHELLATIAQHLIATCTTCKGQGKRPSGWHTDGPWEPCPGCKDLRAALAREKNPPQTALCSEAGTQGPRP